jgi:hypothetical protein
MENLMIRICVALALCAVAGTGFAQTPTGTPMAAAAVPADTAGNAYRALDTHHRGYLTRDEVQSVQGFSFEAADTNKDGRLTREEFARAWGSRYDNSPFGT